MKPIIIAILTSLFLTSTSFGQTNIKFKENGLMNNANAFGPLLCPLDKSKVDEVLKKTIELNLPKKHINGYCEVRAHFLCKKLAPLVKSNGCEIGKIWAFAPSIYTMVSDKKLTTENPLFKGENITWGYHVAPLLALKNGNKIDTVVIDFSIKENAFIPYKEWLKKLNCPDAIYTFTDYNYYLFYTFNGLTLTGAGHNNFTTPTNFPKIITGHFWYLTNTATSSVPSGLAYNDLAIYLTDKFYSNNAYSQYKEQIKDLTKLNEMPKLISGSVSNLPNELVTDCINYYNDRLKYWRTQDK